MECIAIVLVYILAVVVATSVNYCGSRMCANTNAHTFCQFPVGPSPECVGYIDARLSIEEKSRIIARLNRRRNEVAAGKMRGLPTAGDMLKMRWVEELAREAQLWADQCRPPRTPEEHDACRDLYSLTVGQCVASVVGEAPGLRVESMVDIWYMQSKLYKGNVTFYMPSDNGSYSDFAQIIWSRSYMVGCGRSRFMTPWQGRLRSVERLVCNIAPNGPRPTYPLWSPAGPAATCPSRSFQDDVMTSLCDFQRDMKDFPLIDSSMTLGDHLLLNTILEIESNETINYRGSLDQIYLTKMAIAMMMENSMTTQKHYNSMQRRDVVEVILIEDTPANISTEGIPETKSTLPLDNETTTIKVIKITKKRISFIGRPRTYKMEDLTDFDDKTENNTPIEEILPKKEKEFYADYEFVETIDENSTVFINLTNTTEASSIANVVDRDVTREVVTTLYENSSVLYEGQANTTIGIDNNSTDIISPSDSGLVYENSTQNNENVTFTLKDDSIDDYLSDPETVRELQEALDRIEHEMAPNQHVERQGKVRRELRDYTTPEFTTRTNTHKPYSPLIAYNPSLEAERNKSMERSPMFNMVMKYMPYLKQYENALSSSEDGSMGIANCVSPSFVLVLTFCLYCLGIF